MNNIVFSFSEQLKTLISSFKSVSKSPTFCVKRQPRCFLLQKPTKWNRRKHLRSTTEYKLVGNRKISTTKRYVPAPVQIKNNGSENFGYYVSNFIFVCLLSFREDAIVKQ